MQPKPDLYALLLAGLILAGLPRSVDAQKQEVPPEGRATIRETADYLDLIRREKWEDLATLDMAAFKKKYEPLLGEGADAQTLAVCGTVMARWAEVRPDVPPRQKEELYKAARQLLQRATEADNEIALEQLAWMNAEGLGQEKDFSRAVALTKRRLELTEKRTAANSPEVAEVLYDLALLYRSAGEPEKAIPWFARSVTIRRGETGTDKAHLAGMLNLQAEMHGALRQFEAALPLLREARDLMKNARRRNVRLEGAVIGNLAVCYKQLHQYADAAAAAKEAIELYAKAGNDVVVPHAIFLKGELAEIYQSLGREEEARDSVLDGLRRCMAFPEMRSLRARLFTTFGKLLRAKGSVRDAEEVEKLALALRSRGDDSDVARRIEAAERHAAEYWLGRFAKSDEASGPRTAVVLTVLGRGAAPVLLDAHIHENQMVRKTAGLLLNALGELALDTAVAALAHENPYLRLRAGLLVREKGLEALDSLAAAAKSERADLRREAGKALRELADSSVPRLLEVLSSDKNDAETIDRKKWVIGLLGQFGRHARQAGPVLAAYSKHPDPQVAAAATAAKKTIEADSEKASVNSEAGAEPELARAADLPKEVQLRTASAAGEFAIESYMDEKFAQSLIYAELAGRLFVAVHGITHPDTLNCLHTQAGALWKLQRHGEAEKLLNRIIETCDAHQDLAARDDNLNKALNALAIVYMETGREETAETLLRRILNSRESGAARSKGDLVLALQNLGGFYERYGSDEKAEIYLKRAVQELDSADVPAHLACAILNSRGMVLLRSGRTKEAEESLTRALTLCEHSPQLADNHAQRAITLDNLGLVDQANGRLDQARKRHEAALKVFEHHRSYGPLHKDTAICVENLAKLEVKAGNYRDARPHYERVLSIREACFGPNSAEVANTLLRLEMVLKKLGDSSAAESAANRVAAIQAGRRDRVSRVKDELEKFTKSAAAFLDSGKPREATAQLEQALALIQKEIGESPGVSFLFLRLAEQYREIGNYERARLVFGKARRLIGMESDEKSKDMARYYVGYGELLTDVREYAEAEAALRRALEIAESPPDSMKDQALSAYGALGVLSMHLNDYAGAKRWFEKIRSAVANDPANVPAYCAVLSNLGSVAMQQGDAAEAESLLRSAAEAAERKYGRRHHVTSEILGQLGVLYYEIGYHDQALAIFQETIDYLKDTYGPDHRRTILRTNDIAENYKYLGRGADAERLLRDCVVRGKRVGLPGRDIAMLLMNLSELRVLQSDGAEARKLLDEALRFAGPEDQYDTVGPAIVEQIADMEEARGNLRDAEDYYRKAVALYERTVGRSNFRTGRAKCALADVLAGRGRSIDALGVMREGWEVFAKYRQGVLPFSTSQEQLAFAGRIGGQVNRILALAASSKDDPGWVRFAAEVVVSSKGAGLEAMSNRHLNLVAQQGDEARDLLRAWQAAQAAYARESLTPREPGGRPVDTVLISELRGRVEAAEKALSRKSPAFARLREVSQASLADVAAALAADEALVEFVEYRAKGRGSYLAVVIRPGQGRAGPDVHLEVLGEAKVVEAAARRWRNAVLTLDPRQLDGESPPADLEKASGELAGLVWKPIEPHLRGCRKVYLSPDGELSFVPFGALPGAVAGTFLVESFDTAYLGSGRDLVGGNTKEGGPPVVVGEPDFGPADSPAPPPASRPGAQAVKSVELIPFESVRFRSRKGAQAEADEVEACLRRRGDRPRRLQGKEATKGAVRSVAGPQVLHFASHGFFLAETRGAADDRGGLETRGVGGSRPISSAGADSRSLDTLNENAAAVRLFLSDPMRRSGIALAGINETITGLRPVGAEDGILTAEDVCFLNLWGTKLVTISTCESGVGKALSGEGVFGLRRAFVIAGARNLVMTLWPVADAETRKIMVAMYETLARSKSPQSALLESQRRWIEARRKEGKFPHPFYWAAFVASGAGK